MKQGFFIFLCFLPLLWIVPSDAAGFSFFGKADLESALKSSNPKRVDKCLDIQIMENNYSGIVRIREHARNMLRQERNNLVGSGELTGKNIQKRLAPWANIEKKASEYFVRKNVYQPGKSSPFSDHHR